MVLVVVFCLAGLLWAYRNVKRVISIDLNSGSDVDLSQADSITYDSVTPAQKKVLIELGEKISDVAFIRIREPDSSSNRST